jgi:hypothetical protein
VLHPVALSGQAAHDVGIVNVVEIGCRAECFRIRAFRLSVLEAKQYLSRQRLQASALRDVSGLRLLPLATLPLLHEELP